MVDLLSPVMSCIVLSCFENAQIGLNIYSWLLASPRTKSTKKTLINH